MSKGMMALCPLLYFHGSNILNAAIHNTLPSILPQSRTYYYSIQYCCDRIRENISKNTLGRLHNNRFGAVGYRG